MGRKPKQTEKLKSELRNPNFDTSLVTRLSTLVTQGCDTTYTTLLP
jgi:hypothetical protein